MDRVWLGFMERCKATSPKKVALFAIPTTLLLIIICASLVQGASEQFSLLAKAFLHGQLNFLSPIGGAGQDPVYWRGRIYWSEGPFPALLLLPFVAIFGLFHLFFYQAYLQWALVLGVMVLVFKLARRLGYSPEDGLTLAFGFTLGSVFIGVASTASSWFFAQVLTTFLLFWILYEFYRRPAKRWWLLGAIGGLILMTRATAMPIMLFFALEIWFTTRTTAERLKQLAQLCLPVAGAFVLLGVYNFLRFHTPLSGGYASQVLFPSSFEAESYGVFALIHIPTNFYAAVLRAPLPVLRDTTSWTLKFPFVENNIYGMSIFITSPYFLYLFTQKWSSFDTRARRLLMATAVGALLIFSYFGVGLVQFGYRYSLDFLPGLFLLFMIMYKKHNVRLSRGMKFLLLGSGVTNAYLLCSLIASSIVVSH